MIIFYGIRPYGKTRACGASYVVTRFFHIWFLPLVPVGTQLVLEETGGNSYRGIDTSLDFRSVVAGYLRVWGPISVIIAVMMGLGALGDSESGLEMLVTGAFTGFVTLVLLVATVLAFAVMGKLSIEEKQKRSVYALHTGYFVDPADMGMARQRMREGILATIADRARGLASGGYRGPGDPTQMWPQYALDPTHNDDVLVTAAFTLARLDASLAQGPYKSHMEMLHHQLWQRIQRTNAPYLHAHARG